MSQFTTIEQWLEYICANDQPQKRIGEYRVVLFESTNDYILLIVGVNTYEEGKSSSISRLEFEPTHMYFKLPISYFKNLNRKHLMEKLTDGVERFFKNRKI